MEIEEPNFSTSYEADLGGQPATGVRITERRTLHTAWADLDSTPWEQVQDKAATSAAVRRYHEALVAINEMHADDRDAALASIGDLSSHDLYALATLVEEAARRIHTKTK